MEYTVRKDNQFKRMYQGANMLYTYIREEYTLEKLVKKFFNIRECSNEYVKEFKEQAVKQTKEFTSFVSNIIREKISGNQACYRYAGALQAIFEKISIKSDIVIGLACPENMKSKQFGDSSIENLVNKVSVNHVWVETSNKVYESFNGEVDNLYHVFGDKVQMIGGE